MNKILYIILIVFLSLTTAGGIWTFVFGFQMGPEIYKLESFVCWFLLGNVTAFIASILLLKYYYYRNYRFAFFTGIIALIASFVYATIIYVGLTSGELASYRLPTILLYLAAIIVYAAGLILSNTRKRPWLKLAGICGLVVGLVLVFTIIEGTYTKEARLLAF